MVISAEGDANLFPLVRKLVAAAPNLPQWRFVALKPARGFAFRYSDGGIELAPSELAFYPLASSALSAPFLGLRVFVPDELAKEDGIVTALWRILETGLGEERASSVKHVEAAPTSLQTDPDPLRLPDLDRYVAWHLKRHGHPPEQLT